MRGVPRQQRPHAFAKLVFERTRRSEARAESGCLRHRLDQSARRMSVNQRSPRHHVIDVIVTVGVLDARPLAPDDEERCRADGLERADRAVDAAGKDSLRGFEESSGLWIA